MAGRVLPYLVFLYGHFFVPTFGNVVSLDTFLNDYLGRIDVPISVQNLPLEPGITMDLDGECSQVSLNAIDTHEEQFQLRMNVSGLGLKCNIHAKVLTFNVEIDFDLVNAWVDLDVVVPPITPDASDPLLQLPQRVAVDVSGCTGNLNGTHYFKLPFLIRKYQPQIEALLTDPKTICAAVQDVLARFNGTIGKLDDRILENVQEARNDKGLTEATFEDPNGDIATIADNAGTQAIRKLLDTLSDPASPANINKVLKENHGDSISLSVDNDPTANIPCPHKAGNCPLFPLSLDFAVSNYTVGLNITGLEVTGLDTFSNILLQTPGPSKNLVNFTLGLNDLAVTLNVSMRLVKAGAPDEVMEHFSVGLGLKDFAVNIAGFWHFNGTTADQFEFLQLPHAGCLSQAVNSTQAGLTHAHLSLPSLALNVVPAGKPDPLEHGLDDTVYALSQMIFRQYAHLVDQEANWALSIYARNLINSKLTEYLALNVTDEPEPKPHNDTRVCLPPKPAYQSAFLHNGGLYGAIAATAVAVLLLATVPFMKKKNSHKVMKHTPPPMDAGDAAAALTAGAQDPPLDNDDVDDPNSDNVSLARNQKLPLGLRAGLPLLVFANAILFISSNAGSGASIFVDLSAGGLPLFPSLPPAFDFSLVNTIVEMAQGRVWLLVFVIGFFSGVWPYIKLSLMLACWFTPGNKLSVNTRHRMLEFLDAFGKWSLVDTYVLVLFVVAFSVNMECGTAPSPVFRSVCEASGIQDFLFKLYVLPTLGFHTFLIATLMSLVNGLAMSTCHRYVHRIGEFGDADEYERIEGLGNKRRLCSVLKGGGKFTSIAVTVGLMLSMALAVVGVFMTTFQFVFQGVAGLALGDASKRAYSLFGLGEALPGASINPNTFGIHWIQFFFIAFSGVTVLIFLGLLLVLWNVPLTVKGQRTFLVMAQVMNAWSGLDVFVVAILACCLEISQFANFIIGDTGLNALNPYLPLIFAFFPQWNEDLQQTGGANVFTLTTTLEPGFWLLAIAALLSTVIGQMTLNRCSKSLFDANHQPLSETIAASFTNTGASSATGP